MRDNVLYYHVLTESNIILVSSSRLCRSHPATVSKNKSASSFFFARAQCHILIGCVQQQVWICAVHSELYLVTSASTGEHMEEVLSSGLN